SGGGTYSWSPATGLNNSTVANPVANPPSTTIYTLTVTGVGGCTDKDTIIVTRRTLPVISIAPANQIICSGISAQLNASGGVGYSWLPSGSLNNPLISNPVATPTITTTYTVTGTDAFGCSNTKASTVIVNSGPAVTASADDSICIGGSKNIGASSGSAGTYSWLPASGLSSTNTANTVATPTTTTVYTVTLTNGAGCKGKDSVMVIVNQLPNAFAGLDTSLCAGNSVTLAASGGVTYSWSPSTGLSSTTVFNPVATPPGTLSYTLTVTDASGCIDKDTVRVAVNALPNVDAGNYQLVCYNAPAQLSASGATNYSWNPSAGLNSSAISNPVANVNSFTTYTVTGTDANGCFKTDTVSIDVRNPVMVSAGTDDSICAGNSVQLNASAGGNAYSWSPVAGLSSATIANPLASPANTTTYTLTLTDANNCTGIDSVLVKVNQLPNANAGADTAFCAGGSVNLAASGGGAYSWSPAAGLSSSTVSNPSANPAVPTTYTLTVTDAVGCADIDSITININALPVVDAGNYQLVCYNSSTQLSASGAVNYNWSPATGLSSATVFNPTTTLTANVTYTVTGTDASGCSNTDTITVAVRNAVFVDAGVNTPICVGASTTLNATPGANSYSWLPLTGLSVGNIPNPVASPTTTTVYTLTLSDANNCTGKDSVMITVNSLPIANAGNDASFCAGASTVLAASGGGTYSWSPAAGLTSSTSPNPTANPASTTVYTLTVTNTAGCTKKDSVTITVNPLPTITAVGNSPICFGTSTLLQASGGLNYAWIPTGGLSSPTIANPTASPLTTTLYTVMGFDANNCSNTATVSVVVIPSPVVQATGASICFGGTATLNATGATTYSWQPGTLSGASQSVNPGSTTNYTVTGTDANGCSSTATATVMVDPLVTAGFTANPSSGVAPVPVDFTNTTTGALNYAWSFGNGTFSTSSNPSTQTYQDTGMYVVTLIAYNTMPQCADTATLTITVFPEANLIIPNVFTPNGDNINDVFKLLGSGVVSADVKIFDRWGKKVADWKDTLAHTWDGEGHSAGTFYYIIITEGLDGTKKQYSGYLQLIK
ncbi:MAG: gliding motility-associated C-terminal domain-containing protein, partial [Bacteroidia bacterium]